ncbi:unnamed protein product [Symbiodinium natans]|uniref:Uncharacterized protein n=1 Tax=Symbiodinium natans TaxID=878477 RepID=A0A812US69_9DINO|nr:unnamed protein product [Symbiodinium natans]
MSGHDVSIVILRDLQKLQKKFLTWREFTEYHAMVLFPHVPNTISFADAYAMHIPIFLPAEPEAWTWAWSQSDPYAGPGFPLKQQSSPWNFAAKAPDWYKKAGGDSRHPNPAFTHLEVKFQMTDLLDHAYWYQYTEYYLLPHTRTFRGIADLLVQLRGYTIEDALEDSRRIALEQAKREAYVISWMSVVMAQAITSS